MIPEKTNWGRYIRDASSGLQYAIISPVFQTWNFKLILSIFLTYSGGKYNNYWLSDIFVYNKYNAALRLFLSVFKICNRNKKEIALSEVKQIE
jgi:hypothetical protein